LSGFVQSARDITELVVIDGCEVGCAKGVLEHAEVPLRNYLVITDLGIDKNKDMNLKREEIDRLHAILLDEDRDAALDFLAAVIKKKADAASKPHCRPVFELERGKTPEFITDRLDAKKGRCNKSGGSL
jgi:hypothetical protein